MKRKIRELTEEIERRDAASKDNAEECYQWKHKHQVVAKENEEWKRQVEETTSRWTSLVQSLTEEREQWKQNHQAVTKENEELKGQIQRLTEEIKMQGAASEQSVHKITTELSKHQEATRTGAGLQVPLPLRFAAAH